MKILAVKRSDIVEFYVVTAEGEEPIYFGFIDRILLCKEDSKRFSVSREGRDVLAIWVNTVEERA